MDYNSYYQNSSNTNDTSPHKRTYATNPFVDIGANNFHLAAATDAGISLPSPYNTDMGGILRGSDGAWDRGAYSFVSGVALGPALGPNPPTALTVVVH
jgi:hypothetical protein